MQIKLVLLSMLISGIPMMRADLANVSPATQQEHAAQPTCSMEQEVTAQADEQEDAFDALMDSEVPAGLISMPKPVSVWQGYVNQVGGSLLMNYIALKIWAERQWNWALTHYGTQK